MNGMNGVVPRRPTRNALLQYANGEPRSRSSSPTRFPTKAMLCLLLLIVWTGAFILMTVRPTSSQLFALGETKVLSPPREPSPCLGWRATKYCAPLGWPMWENDGGCFAALHGNDSGFCECVDGIIVERSCQVAPAEFTCHDKCVEALTIEERLEARKDRVGARSESPQPSNYTPYHRFEDFSEPDSDVPAGPTKQAASKGKETKLKAVYVTLTKLDRYQMLQRTLNRFEKTVNARLQYDYAMFAPTEYPHHIQAKLVAQVSTNITFNVVSRDRWRLPPSLSREQYRRTTKPSPNARFMDSHEFRHSARWWTVFFFREEALRDYDYFWRLADEAFYYCPTVYDPVQYLHQTGRAYAFVTAFREPNITNPTVFPLYKKYLERANLNLLWPEPLLTDNGTLLTECHIDTTSEIARLDFFRSKNYASFVDNMDLCSAHLTWLAANGNTA
ncbi:Glycolipid 2-alpha-mannosyltransferase 1 [Diplonema papillatum]|nr:Glycolipid 2-alpha-mannosyltransferase 1 [Diplonema papillatum]